MLGFITNLNFTEIGVVLIGAVMVFGKDLPRVVIRGLQHLAKLRKAVTEMWREAGLEQEFKRVKAELEPEFAELASAKKTLSDGKSLLNGPVAHWRKNIGLEVEDAIAVGSAPLDDFDDEPTTEIEVADSSSCEDSEPEENAEPEVEKPEQEPGSEPKSE